MQNKCKTKKKHVEGQCLKDKKADFLSILFHYFNTIISFMYIKKYIDIKKK